jgi:hypothetical protein
MCRSPSWRLGGSLLGSPFALRGWLIFCKKPYLDGPEGRNHYLGDGELFIYGG